MINSIVDLKRVGRREGQYWLLCLPAIVFFIIFHYFPMYGVIIAFKKYAPALGISGSPWVGLKYFEKFLSSFQFKRVIINTIGISALEIIIGFPIPIIFALLLNQTKNQAYKRIAQIVTYAPHFISIVVLSGMLLLILSPTTGFVNHFLLNLGMTDPIFFFGSPEWFKPIYIISGIWQNTGWGTIIYLAALSGIDPCLYEAAKVDGCNKWKLIWHIDIPGILPTSVILLIMRIGRIMNVGFQKAYLLQNPLNTSSSEIISTYVYKVGLIQNQFSYSTAVGLFNTVINILLLVFANSFAKKMTETSLW